MIVYGPLSETLKRKGMTLKEVSEKAGISEAVLRSKMNSGEYITMENLDRICMILNVKVEEVIKWQRGAQNSLEKYKVNWLFLIDSLIEKKLSLNKFSLACRLGKSTVSRMRLRDSYVRLDIIKSMAKVLECEVNDLIILPVSREGFLEEMIP